MKRKKDKIYMVISIGTKLKKNSVPIHGKTKQNKTKQKNPLSKISIEKVSFGTIKSI